MNAVLIAKLVMVSLFYNTWLPNIKMQHIDNLYWIYQVFHLCFLR